MKPVRFKEQTNVLAEDQPQYLPLPVKINLESGEIVSCWKLSWRERFKLFCTGRVWVSISTFGRPMQPVYITIEKEDLIEPTNKKSYYTKLAAAVEAEKQYRSSHK